MISFIVPAHNEQELIGSALESIGRSAPVAGRPFEIIVANDATTDSTGQVARAHGAQVIDINRRQISAVRNEGARVARGDLLVFLDADTQMSPDIMRGVMRELRRGALGGGARVQFSADAPWAAALGGKAFLFVWSGILRWAAGCFIFVRRDVFNAIGGFDEHYFIAEEMALSRAVRRLGRFVILPEKVTTSARKMHLVPPGQLLIRTFRVLKRGESAFHQREGLDMWYDWRPPSNAPAAPAPKSAGGGSSVLPR